MVLRATGVTTGAVHTCAHTLENVAFCWGGNTRGQLGIGTFSGTLIDPEPVPRIVVGDLTFVGIVAGDLHTCALDDAGQAHCWGLNEDGQLGQGDRINRPRPSRVIGSLPFATVTAGGSHSCALTAGGEAYCWGGNRWGQLGVGESVTESLVPRAVSGHLKFVALRAGAVHTCGIALDGTAYCWGRNAFGELGVGDSGTIRTSPTPVAGGVVFTTLNPATEHTCGITSSGDAYCWGRNDAGELGDGQVSIHAATPTRVQSAVAWAWISGGLNHTCAVAVDGAAYCWGSNSAGQLGDGNLGTGSPVPVPVVGGLRFIRISAGALHTCAVTATGDVYCWGRDNEGQLGDGINVRQDRDRPAPVVGTPAGLQ